MVKVLTRNSPPCGDARGVVPLGVDAVAAAVLAVALSRRRRSRRRRPSPPRGRLVVGGDGVDAELAALRRRRRRRSAGRRRRSRSPSWPSLCQATTKSPSASIATAGNALGAGGEGVDAELVALGDAGGVVALGVDAVAAAVLAVARPGDDEVAVGVHRHRRGPTWSPAVEVLTRNSPPCGYARRRCTAGRRRRRRCRPGRSSCQATTKSPSASIATAGVCWFPSVKVLTRNSLPSALPAASYCRAGRPRRGGSRLQRRWSQIPRWRRTQRGHRPRGTPGRRARTQAASAVRGIPRRGRRGGGVGTGAKTQTGRVDKGCPKHGTLLIYLVRHRRSEDERGRISSYCDTIKVGGLARLG